MNELSKWAAEQMGVSYYKLYEDGVGRFPRDINDPACQMAIIEWCDVFHKARSGLWTIGKGLHTGDAMNIKDALIALREAMGDE